MPQIVVTTEEDKALEAICPEYLKGGGRTNVRVRWAIERVLLADIEKKAEESRKGRPPVLDGGMAWRKGRGKGDD